MNFLGLDIGGAFIKYALLSAKGKPSRGIVPFELWKQPEKLAAILKSLRPKKPYAAAITMTGELCDCFENRREGVRHIVEAAQKALGTVAVYGVKGGLLSPGQAVRRHREVASANWPLVPRRLSLLAKNFLMVDVGSTTTDLTPVRDGRIANNGFTDYERLRHGELLYTGALRTPLSAVTGALKIGGKLTPLAAERLQKILAEKNLPNHGLRVFVAGGGCSGSATGGVCSAAGATGAACFTGRPDLSLLCVRTGRGCANFFALSSVTTMSPCSARNSRIKSAWQVTSVGAMKRG